MINEILFWVLAITGLMGGIGLITSRNPIYSVLYLIVNFFAIAGLYLMLGAEFLAVIQIIVYAGAIMVLFLFVIMLLNLGKEEMQDNTMNVNRVFAYALGLVFLAQMLYAFGTFQQLGQAGIFNYVGPFDGRVENIGRHLMTDYVFPFEMISVVLLAALLGAMAIAKKHGTKKTGA